MRSIGELFPEGEYAMEVTRVEDPQIGRTEYYFCKVHMIIVGTDHEVIWLISESPNAKWVWRQWIDNFDDREQLMGRTFLCRLKHVTWNGRIYERIESPILELP